MKYDERACKFNMDTGCVELLLRDGRKISIGCTGVEDALNVTMAQQTELDYGFTDGEEHPLIGTAIYFHLTKGRAKKTEEQAMDNLWLELPWWFLRIKRKNRDCATNFLEIYVQLYDFEKFCGQTK